MSIYIWEQEGTPAVKVGRSWNPKKRIKGTDHWFPPIFIRIYQIIKTNGLTLKDIDNDIKESFKDLNYRCDKINSSTEFYRRDIVAYLDMYFENLQQTNKINYVKFNSLQDYENNKLDIEQEIEYDLKNDDPNYEINLEIFSEKEFRIGS